MPCQSNLNLQELKVCLPSLDDTDARNCHMSSRLCIAHLMSTVLSVYTSPVRTHSETRAGVHNDVSSPSVAQQSRSSRQLEGKRSPASALQMNGNLADAMREKKKRKKNWRRSPNRRLKHLGKMTIGEKTRMRSPQPKRYGLVAKPQH